MAELLHLDAAAKLVGKSEVTLRRLVKAGKIPAQKEKTLTGFIYLVSAADVKGYYSQRGSLGLGSDPAPRFEMEPEEKPRQAPIEAPAHKKEEEELAPQNHAVVSQGKVRVAISGAEGDPVQYWLRRAESYEDRYHKEILRTSELREELGLWRGRAEHAQSLLMKLLPAPGTVEVTSRQAPTEQVPTTTVRRLTFAGMMILVAFPILMVIGGILIYILLK